MLQTILSGVVGQLVIAVCWSLSLASAQTAERVFSLRSPSIVVVRVGTDRQGSGVVVAPRLVATNCHVTDGSGSISVRRGRVGHAAHRAWAQSVSDICLLDVPTLDTPPAPIGLASNLRVGAQVFAIGAPAGLELSLSAGIVSQLRQEGNAPLVQTSAAISPGSSGGGLFDERGQLVGITTMSVRQGQNLNFAVPVEWLRDAMAALEDWRRCRTSPSVACLIASTKSLGSATANEPLVVSALLHIARAHLSVGSRTAAEAALADAVEYARDSPSILRPLLLSNIAEIFGEAGQTARSVEFFQESLTNFSNNSIGYLGTRSSMSGSEGSERAFSDLLTFSELFPLRSIVNSIHKILSSESARRMIHERLSGQERADALIYLAQRRVETEDARHARETLTQALDEGREGSERQRSEIRRLLLHFQVPDVDAAAALARVRLIQDTPERIRALMQVAEGQASDGDARGAAGTRDEALRLARLEGLESRARALFIIALAEARNDRFTEALAVAREIRDIGRRSSALISIAGRQAEVATPADTTRTISEVINLIDQSHIRDHNNHLWHVAEIQAKIGTTDAAMTTVSRITDPLLVSFALVDISKAQEHRRDFDGLVRTRRRIYMIHSSPENLGDLARAQAQANDIQGALASLDGIGHLAVRITTLGGIAAALVNRR